MLSPLLAALLAGCAVDQKKEVAKYRHVLDGDNPPPQVTYSPDEPLTLDKAMRLANQDNERIALAGEDYLQALINKDRAASSFLPTVSLEPNYTITDKPNSQAGGSGAVGTIGGFRVGGSTLRRFEAPVVSRINLFNGFGDVARLRRAGAVAEQRRFQLLDQQALTLLDVAQVYFQVLRSERLIQVLESSSRVQDERVRDIEARQNAGLARPLDVAQTRAQAADTRVSLTTARSDARNGRTTLAFLIGAPRVDGPLDFSTEGDLAATSALEPLETVQERALNQREDVLAARASITAAEQGVRAAISQYYPSVSLNFNAFLYRENFDDASKWTAVLNANLPIFTAGLIHADVREAWSLLRQAALFDSLTTRQVVQDVHIAYENVLASRARLTDLRTQVDAARDALNQAEASYRVGLATNLERLAAQSQELDAELQMASEQYDQSLLLLDLTRFTGRVGQRGSGGSGNSAQTLRVVRSTGGISTGGVVTGGSSFNGTTAGANGLGTTGVR
jgi:outer membrane protein TolC